MAKYTVNEKAKEVVISGKLTPLEQQILGMYIDKGYTIKAKQRASSKATAEDVKEYFKIKNDDKGLKDFNAKKEEMITDKNGEQRKAGFLTAMKWLRDTQGIKDKDILKAIGKIS